MFFYFPMENKYKLVIRLPKILFLSMNRISQLYTQNFLLNLQTKQNMKMFHEFEYMKRIFELCVKDHTEKKDRSDLRNF